MVVTEGVVLSSPAICNVLIEPYVIFYEKPLHICCLMFCWVLSNWVTLVRYSSCFLDHKHVHVTSICYIPTLGIGITIHPFHIVNAPCLGDLSRRTSLKKIKSDFGCPKKRKDGMPKKHGPKKRERKGVIMSQIKKRDRDHSREKTNTSRSKSHPSIHSYTCTFWSRLHDLFLHGSSLWLYNIQNTSVPYLILPWAPQRLVVVGRIKGRYCPSKKIQDECLERVILGVLPCFQKSLKKYLQMDCGSMNK